MLKPKILTDTRAKAHSYDSKGLVLGMVVISLGILTALAIGLLSVAYGARRQAIAIKADVAAMMAAEAGYERAVFWMSQQQDMLSALEDHASGNTGSVTFPDSACTYEVSLFTFAGSRPIFRILSQGYSGICKRTVDVKVVQAVSGWDIGICEIPYGSTETSPVNFASGETIDMPISINEADDRPDERDIHISGNPDFQAVVAMGESRYTSGGSDKYRGVMGLFEGGIYFDQPLTRITDESTIQRKINRFLADTKSDYCFTPSNCGNISNRQPAVQLEFFVEGGVGKVRITNNCTVRGYHQNQDSRTYDFKIQSGSGGRRFERYDIYAYHVVPDDADYTGERITVPVEETYVTPTYNGVTPEPGGQIYVNGNVIIGGNDTRHNNDQMVKGRITVVATGNIWIADSIYVDGNHDNEGKPTLDNPNILGLLAQGVIKVVDPGLSTSDNNPGGSNYDYAPIGRPDNNGNGNSNNNGNGWNWGWSWGWGQGQGQGQSQTESQDRHLPDPIVVEAAMTIGGGGWGAENVQRGSYGGRKEYSGNQDYLVVHGSICEAIRGVVGIIGGDGFLKAYYMDQRLLTGIVPGDIWLRGKYVPAPAGWHDYRPVD